MKKIRTFVLAVVLVIATVGLTAPLTAAPASAAVGCQRGGCTGLDPEVQGCGADARTVDSFLGHYQNNLGADVYVELRHSDACHARWIRVKSGPSDWGCGGGSQPQVRLRDLNASGSVIDQTVRNFSACANFPVWSKMIGRTSGAKRVQFCFREEGWGWGSDSFYHPCKYQAWP